MDQKFKNTDDTLTQALQKTLDSITSEKIKLGELLELVGEQGLLFFCAILVIPFLFPVSIPGVSTIFGSVIILIGIGVTLNRLPYLPKRILDAPIQREHLVPMLERGLSLFARIDRITHPRLQFFSRGNLITGLALTFSGVLLIFPLGLIPFSNTLPGLAILLLALGMLQRDGLLVLGGYISMLATVIYFGGLAYGTILAGQSMMSMFGG